MLSTISGTPAFLAMAAIAGRSTMTPPGLAIDSQKMARVLGVTALAKLAGSVESAHFDVPVELLEGVVELVDRAAVELPSRDELVAGLHQGVEHDRLRGVSRGHGECRRAAFERRDALLQHRLRGAADARVDVAERLQAEQRGGMVDVVEDIGRGLVDGRDARARGRIGRRPRVDRKRRKSRRCVRWLRHRHLLEFRRGHTGANRGCQVNDELLRPCRRGALASPS